MKTMKLSVLALTVIGLALTGCGKKNNNGGNNNPPEPQTRYTVTEEEYLEIRSLMASPRIFLDINVTFYVHVFDSHSEITDEYEISIDYGKVERYNHLEEEDEPSEFFDLSYSETLGTYRMIKYAYDDYEYEWRKTTYNDYNPQLLRDYLSMEFLTYMAESFDDVTYSEQSQEYTCSHNTTNVTMGFEDGKLDVLFFEYIDNGENCRSTWTVLKYETTTINFPQDAVDED